MSSDLPDIFLGIDLSLTDTGFSAIDDGGNILFTKSIKTNPKSLDFARVLYTTTAILNDARAYAGDHKVRAFIEAIPFAPRPNGKTYTRTELFGIVKYGLVTSGIDTYVIGATTLKKEFASHGAAGKDAVIAAVHRRFGRLIKNDNVADSLGLASLGRDHFVSKLRFSMEKMPMI